MAAPKIKLGRLLGITLQIDPTWFIIFILITLSSSSQFAQQYPHWTPLNYWVVGILTSILFFVSVVLHELAHSAVAISRGIPVRSITLFIFGGVAQISREANRPGTEFLVAVAGPATSVLVAIVFRLVWLWTRGSSELVAALAAWLSATNFLLALFNLIPGFPLDGGRILRSVLWGLSGNFNSATRAATLLGRVIAYVFIISGVAIALWGGNFINGLWIGFVGWFLLNAALQSYQQVLLKESLAGIKANDLMTRECPRVPPGITLAQFLDDFLFPSGKHYFLIMDQDLLLGVITLHEVNKVPRDRWGEVRVEEVMIPLQNLKWVRPDQDIAKILESMDREGISQVPVVDQGRLVGIVGRQEILRLLQKRLEVPA
jgi:Zn-dependent protease/CBS domain-containing protein